MKDIRCRNAAIRRQASKDSELIGYATEIRLRAERRAGKLLKEMEKAKGALEPGVGKACLNAVASDDRVSPPSLADLGVTKTQSSRRGGL